MFYEITRVGQTATVHLHGTLHFDCYREWREMMNTALEVDAKEHELDISDVASINTAGLGLILEMRNQVRNNHSALTIKHCMPEHIRCLLDLAELPKLVPVH